MTKVRIYEWAKKNNKQSSEVVKELTQKGHKVRNHTSIIDEEILNGLLKKEVKYVPKKKVSDYVSPNAKPDTHKENTNNNTTNNSSRPGQTGTKPAYNSSRPGQTGTKPVYNSNRPGQTGTKPTYNSSRPGQTGTKPTYNSSRPGQTGTKPTYNSSRPGQTGSKPPYNSNRPGQTGSRPPYNSNRPGQTGNKPPYNSNRPSYAGGKPGFKKVEDTKPEVEDTQKKVTKKTTAKVVRPKYDRFKIFDKEDTKNLDSGKTKTQLKKEAREDRQKEISLESKKVTWDDDMTVSSFASKIDIPVTDIIAKLFELGIMSTVNQNLSQDVAEVISDEYNVEIIGDTSNSEFEFENLFPKYEEKNIKKRPPVVTVMGHVDHGKTTLLDTLRKANVAKKESGGITQHIGAYQIKTENSGTITFLDTPGHAAFTAMRARGADITDITILVVAADDGVMPQTVEAINHAKASDKPIIVAVNKMDKQGASSEKILSELSENGLIVEQWGGETPVVEISALTGLGIDKLLEYIKTYTDLLEYKASFEGRASGTVIEANLNKGKGPVATVLVEQGILNLKDSLIIGDTWGTIRVLEDENGVRHNKVSPSTPIEIVGLKDVPQAGDKFVVAQNVKEAQDIGEKRAALKRSKDRANSHALSLEELNNLISQGDIKELPVIIKGDVQGSVEALASSLEKIEVNGVKVRVISRGVGSITESDVLLATANNTIVIGFNVRPDVSAKKKIESEKVELIVNDIIYKIIEQIEDSMMGMKEKKYTQDVVGHAVVQEVFKISNVGKIAGSLVTEGKINRNCKMRLVRDGVVLYDGDIGQLKRYKDDVSEVIEGQDCGLSFENYQDLKKGDELEAYKIEEIED